MQEQDPGGPVVISSLVVHTRGDHTDSVRDAIRALDHTENVKSSA